MKAKDHIAAIQQARADGQAEDEIILNLLRGLGEEARALGLRRGGNRTEIPIHIAQAILREQDLKYRAIAHACNYNPNGWKELWADKGVSF